MIFVTGTEYARETLVGNADKRVRFAVFQEYVILGLVLLNQVIFQQKSIAFGIDNGKLNVADVGNEFLGFFVVLRGFIEIAAHPLPDIHRFAYVNNLVAFVEKLINARPVRQVFNLLTYDLRRRHAIFECWIVRYWMLDFIFRRF